MRTIFDIFYKTKSTYEYLDNQYEEVLNNRNSLIFFTIGLLTVTDSYFVGEIDRLGNRKQKNLSQEELIDKASL